MSKAVQFTFGCDPEIFIKENGNPASAYGLIPGSKEAPHKTDGGAVQVDGMALEFNTDPVPANDFETFNARIVQQIRTLRDMIPKNLSLSVEAVQEFGKEFLDSQPDDAKELGCDPDWNAYTKQTNPRPDADEATFRTGAGHVHIGWGADIPTDNEEHIEICSGFVQMLDGTVGLFMTYIDREPRRRELYGKAGAFRPKPYGVEYRTPSNAWIKNRSCRKIVHYLMNRAIYYHSHGQTVAHLYNNTTQDDIVRIINEGDHEKAYNLLSPYFQEYVFNAPHGDWKKVVQTMNKKDTSNG